MGIKTVSKFLTMCTEFSKETPDSFHLMIFIKSSEKCARRDWSERVHYISIKHAPYVTRVHCRDIMLGGYVISTSAYNSRYIL